MGLPVLVIGRSGSGKTYSLRLKTVLDSEAKEMFLDYIELCPENVYNNTQYVEDMY